MGVGERVAEQARVGGKETFWAGVALPAVVGDALDRAQKALDAGGAMVYSCLLYTSRCV